MSTEDEKVEEGVEEVKEASEAPEELEEGANEDASVAGEDE